MRVAEEDVDLQDQLGRTLHEALEQPGKGEQEGRRESMCVSKEKGRTVQIWVHIENERGKMKYNNCIVYSKQVLSQFYTEVISSKKTSLI